MKKGIPISLIANEIFIVDILHIVSQFFCQFLIGVNTG
jgi:hypothetical protein